MENAPTVAPVERLVRLPFEPFYDRDGITIYNIDCRQVLPFIGRCDLLLTDPPYGIGASRMNLGMWRTSRMEKHDWDNEAPPRWLLEMMLEWGIVLNHKQAGRLRSPVNAGRQDAGPERITT